MDTTKPLVIDIELARRLKEAAAAGRSVPVTIDDHIYQLSITAEPATDLWEDYDPERVREAARHSAAMGSTSNAADLDAMIAEIRSQREQAPRESSS